MVTNLCLEWNIEILFYKIYLCVNKCKAKHSLQKAQQLKKKDENLEDEQTKCSIKKKINMVKNVLLNFFTAFKQTLKQIQLWFQLVGLIREGIKFKILQFIIPNKRWTIF